MTPLGRLRARYVSLLVLRWMPTGMFITVFVLLMQHRGLSLAEIGLATAAQGAVMLVLELPSGGLADSWGRKRVLLVAGVVGIGAACVVLAAGSVLVLAVASALLGVWRALDSGPLESWYVDEATAVDPGLDVERELGWGDVAICSGIGAGALVASGLVRLDAFGGVDPLVLPLVVGIGLQAVGLVAVALLVDERHPPAAADGTNGFSVGGVRAVMGEAVSVIRSSRLLAALVLAELLWGFGMLAFEVLMPPRLADLAGGPDDAAALLGPAVALAWVLSATGAALAPALARRWGSGRAGAGLRLLHGLTVAAMALAVGPVGLIVAYLATYGVHGASGPIHYGMVHRSVEGAHRATVVSANSLAGQVGGAVSGIAVGALADAAGIPVAMFVCAAVLAAAAPLYLAGGPGGATTVPVPPPLDL